MGEEFTITANNGKTYESLKAYHIALGHAVRQALLDFSEEIADYCRGLIEGFYAEYSPEYYERDYQLLDKMQLDQLIKAEVKGSFEKKYDIEIEAFDSDVLDSHSNGKGKYGTFQDFNGDDARSLMENYLGDGIRGHQELHLNFEIEQYIKKHLDSRVQDVLDNF